MGYVEDAEKVFKDWYSTRDKKYTIKILYKFSAQNIIKKCLNFMKIFYLQSKKGFRTLCISK